jgi:hypothetical protein
VSYTKPELRDRLKEEILSSSTAGTAAGKWSARKALLLAKRYKAEGGGYAGGRTKKQKELKDWADKH